MFQYIVHEAQHITQEDREERLQRLESIAVRDLEFRHHDGDDDGEDAVAGTSRRFFPMRCRSGGGGPLQAGMRSAGEDGDGAPGKQDDVGVASRTDRHVALDNRGAPGRVGASLRQFTTDHHAFPTKFRAFAPLWTLLLRSP